MNTPLGTAPEVFYFKAGDTVWDKTNPKVKFKILEVIHGYFGHGAGTIDLLTVQNTETKDIEQVLATFVTKHDPEEMWQQEESALRSIEELEDETPKPKDMISAEFLEDTLPSEVLASVRPINYSDKELVKYLLADYFVKKSGTMSGLIEEWLQSANYSQSPDEVIWVFDDMRRVACKLGDYSDLQNVVCFHNNIRVSASQFFMDTKPGQTEILVLGNKYLLSYNGKRYEINQEDLDTFLDDHDLQSNQIKACLLRTGVWKG